MKKLLTIVVVFFALGCVIPSAVAQTSKDAAADQCIRRDVQGNPCTLKPPAAHHAAAAGTESKTKVPCQPSDKLVEVLAASQIQLATTTAANQQRETDGFVLAQEALKLQADTDSKRIAIESQDANTRQYIAEHNYELDARRVTVEELNAVAYRKYLPKFASAASRTATAALIGAFTTPMGQIGSAIITGPMKITANGGSSSSSAVGQGGAGGSASASAVAP